MFNNTGNRYKKLRKGSSFLPQTSRSRKEKFELTPPVMRWRERHLVESKRIRGSVDQSKVDRSKLTTQSSIEERIDLLSILSHL
jgi:hypothetical protein